MKIILNKNRITDILTAEIIVSVQQNFEEYIFLLISPHMFDTIKKKSTIQLT